MRVDRELGARIDDLQPAKRPRVGVQTEQQHVVHEPLGAQWAALSREQNDQLVARTARDLRRRCHLSRQRANPGEVRVSVGVDLAHERLGRGWQRVHGLSAWIRLYW